MKNASLINRYKEINRRFEDQLVAAGVADDRRLYMTKGVSIGNNLDRITCVISIKDSYIFISQPSFKFGISDILVKADVENITDVTVNQNIIWGYIRFCYEGTMYKIVGYKKDFYQAFSKNLSEKNLISQQTNKKMQFVISNGKMKKMFVGTVLFIILGICFFYREYK